MQPRVRVTAGGSCCACLCTGLEERTQAEDISTIRHHKYQSYAASVAFLSSSAACYWMQSWAHFHRPVQSEQHLEECCLWLQVNPRSVLIYHGAGTASFKHSDAKFSPWNRHQSNNVRMNFNSSKPMGCRDLPFFSRGNCGNAHRQLHELSPAVNPSHHQLWIYHSSSTRSWNPTLQCVGECLAPVTSSLSLCTKSKPPKASLTESQAAVQQMKSEHLSAEPPAQALTQQPCWPVSKQTLLLVMADSRQKNALLTFLLLPQAFFLQQGHICVQNWRVFLVVASVESQAHLLHTNNSWSSHAHIKRQTEHSIRAQTSMSYLCQTVIKENSPCHPWSPCYGCICTHT